MEKEKMLLVLSILEGRHFPRRVLWHLTVEARFDGEVMITDPIDHSSSPDFNTELAWEVDRRGLNVLKKQRTPIKLQCYAQNKKTGEKESVGYIVLDLTLAQHPTMKPKWFPILNSKYREKPELLLSLGLEDDRLDIDDKPNILKNEIQNPVKQVLKTKEKKTYNLDDLVPNVNEDGEFYQIGPIEECKDFFTFSVTVGFASNLEQLIPSETLLPENHQGFFFYYLLLGNEIYTDPFPDLSLANFAAERATVDLRSSVEALRSFFSITSKIQIHLCCGDKSLGSAEVPLEGLVAKPMTDQPVTIENLYELKTSRQSQMVEVPEAMKPTVGIVLTLKKNDNSKAIEPVILNSSPEIAAKASEILSPPNVRRNLQYPTTPPQKLEREPEVITIDDQSQADEKLQEFPTTPKSDTVTQVHNENNDAASFEDLVTYSFCIDLRTVKNISVETPFNCFVRYSYSYFGDVAPMLTHPAVDVRRGCSSILPHGYATFSFMTKPKQLDEIFRKNPIRIDILHKDLSKDRDFVIGSSLLQLGHLLDSEKSLTVDESGKSGWRRSVLSTLPVISKESHHKVAEIQLFTALDDFGPASESEEIVNTREVQSKEEEEECNMKVPSARQETLEDRLAEQAALEIEKWKEWQEATFLKQLKERETKHLETITSEWTHRETERELLLQRKLSECQALEDKLKRAMDNIEKKERELTISEAEVKRMKTDLQLDYERQMLAVKDTARRLKEEFEHKTELEKNKTKALHEQCVKLQRQLSELEKKSEIREAEFQAFRDTKAQPEVRLQSELKLNVIEKAEMERKILYLTKSKVHYKQQYARGLRELARIKQAMQSEAQAQLLKQQQELEQMRLQIMVSEQQENVAQQRQVIETLKSDLHRMKITNNKTTSDDNTGPSRSSESKKRIFSSKIEETQLAHLMEERETFLRTGLYSPEDQIIEELDRRINKLIEEMNR